jgi:hypothetical protein
MPTKTYGFDAPRVTRDEAVELCVYHLQLASAYFQVVPEGGKELHEEIKRKMKDDHYAYDSAIGWAQSIEAAYEAGKERD